MNFLNPFFLFGLLAIAIPIVLHFINFRKPRQVAFSTIAFFSELQKTTLKRLNIKRLLLLAVRSLALIFLALALARPFLPAQLTDLSSGRSPILYGMLIDNSPGMNQIDENGPYIDQAKEFAEDVISQAKSNDQFLIMTTHGDPGHIRAVNQQEAERLLKDVEVENKGAYTSEQIKFIAQQLSQDNVASGMMYWISHGQKTHISSLDQLMLDEDGIQKEFAPVQFVKIGKQSDANTAVTAIRSTNSIISSGNPFSVEIEVQNYGREPVYNQFLSLDIEGNSMGEYQVDLDAGQSESYVFEVVPQSPGDLKGLARLEGGTYTFDDKRYFSISIPETRQILLVRDDRQNSEYRSYLKPVLEAAGQTNSRIRFNELPVDQLKGESIEDYDAVMLDGLVDIPDFIHSDLQRFVQEGKGLIIFPSEGSDLNSYNTFLDLFNAGQFTGLRGDYGRFEQIGGFHSLIQGHPILDEIFEKQEDEEISITMPDLYYYWIYNPGGQSHGNTIFNSNLNEPLLTEHRYGDGLLMVSSLGADPGWSNFPANSLFAPVYFRMALYAVSFEDTRMQEHILGRPFDRGYAFSNLDIEIEINDINVRPEAAITAEGVQIHYNAKDWEPGWAKISDGQEQRSLAINQDVSESDFEAFTIQELEDKISKHLHLLDVMDTYNMSVDDMNFRIGSAGFGREIWNWFVWLALVLLVIECLITSKYKAER
ncbi:MAG: BatA domain-containing protein [Balneolales bacterium]